MKTVLPLLIEGTGLEDDRAQEEERVLVIASPLSELVDETIRLHRHPDYAHLVVDEKQQAFFEAVAASLHEALAKLGQIQFVPMELED